MLCDALTQECEGEAIDSIVFLLYFSYIGGADHDIIGKAINFTSRF